MNLTTHPDVNSVIYLANKFGNKIRYGGNHNLEFETRCRCGKREKWVELPVENGWYNICCNDNLTSLERHRQSWQGKSDEWLFERLDNELKQKIEEIQRLTSLLNFYQKDL